FKNLDYVYLGSVEQLPFYFLLGSLCGISAVSFTKSVYWMEDALVKWIPAWWGRALFAGILLGAVGLLYPAHPPLYSDRPKDAAAAGFHLPAVFGVGYPVISHTLHLRWDEPEPGKPPDDRARAEQRASVNSTDAAHGTDAATGADADHFLLDRDQMRRELLWLLPLVFLKPMLTSLTLAGGGSGGIFAPSLFLGATLGGSFGLAVNLFVPGLSMHPGVYAIVGMGAVVAGTTHAPLSAILIVYEMTNEYQIILPIMIAAGLASVVAAFIDPESIYDKKLSRRGEIAARGHHLSRLEHIQVRDLMIEEFPLVSEDADLREIIETAAANPRLDALPVMDQNGRFAGVIGAEELHRVVDADIPAAALRAWDLVQSVPIHLTPDENLLEALRDFGERDMEILPVMETAEPDARLIGLLTRSEVMRRYRRELLTQHSSGSSSAVT
ncbi:MAG: chloride channel protein, partial [Planctomycetales bacterium]